jgi:outer membrane protease
MFGKWGLFGVTVAWTLVMAGAASAGNPFLIEQQQPAFTSSFAMRYWYGFGSTSKNLYDASGAELLSRLTYDNLRTHTLEGFMRVDSASGLFMKGYAGGGLLASGGLDDEDFPPTTTPYSSTLSTQQPQGLGYASVDFGGALIRGADFRLDGFVGYHYLNEHFKAFGCQQIASNGTICNPTISDSTAVISQENTWQSLRVGLNADLPIVDRLRLNLDAAWLPYVWFNGTDSHLLRIGNAVGDFTGAIPEDGHGWGYQFDAVLSYRVTDAIDVGLGGRYWHMQSHGYAHFEDHVVGVTAYPQVLDWKTDHYGLFLQGRYSFGAI